MHIRKEPAELLKQLFDKFGDGVCISWSGGKSSTVVMDIARRIKSDVFVLFNDTGVEFKETLDYVNMMAEKLKLNFHRVRPPEGVTFWSVANEYGLPEPSTSRALHRSPKCCYYLKTYPAAGFMWDNNIRCNVTGLQSVESHNRAMLAGRYDNSRVVLEGIPFSGQLYYSHARKRWHAHPLIHWRDPRIYNYFERNKIPLNPVYKNWGGIYKRQGCYTCTFYSRWQMNMSASHPKVYEKIKLMYDKQQEPRRYQPVKS